MIQSMLYTCLVCVWSLWAACLCASAPVIDSALKIDAGQALYNGNTLLFKDHVHLIHDLGDITSGQIEVVPHPQDKKIDKGKLKLSQQVNIRLRQGGQLNCAVAEIDLGANRGVFEGDASEPLVKYLESISDKSHASPVPVILTSKKMTVEIAREIREANSQMAAYLSRLVAEDQVTIDYNHDFIAQADFASFDKLPHSPEVSSSAYPGIISMKSHQDAGLCRITNLNGDLIQAKHISIDTATKQIGCSYPSGVVALNHSEEKSQKSGLDFKADSLVWKDLEQQLVLKDHVFLDQKGFLQLANEDQIILSQAVVNKKKQIDTIESRGKTLLTGFEEEKNKEHHLTCYGRTLVDHSRLLILMESPVDDSGRVPEDQQVFFEDHLGTIYADKLAFQYSMEDKSILPQKLVLEGNVKMLNSYASGSDPNSPLIRYVIADKVEYNPRTKEAIFTSHDNLKRVLFYDKANNMEVSATTLKIKRDEATKKETVKGVGDVRFSFVENEFEQLRKRFVIDRNTIKDKSADESK